MNASQICQLLLLAGTLLSGGCGLFDHNATQKPSNSGLVATPVTYYSTSRARYLGAKYKENLDRLVERIVRDSKTANLQFANNIASVGGIGFFTHSATKTADERYLEVVLAAPETFDTKGAHSDKVNRLFNSYGVELLTILSGDNEIYQDKELSGYGLNLAWRNVITEPAGNRVSLERAIVYLSKEKTRSFLRKEINQNELLAAATIFAVEEDGPLNLISYRAPEAPPEYRSAIREDDITPASAAAKPAQPPIPAKTAPPEQDKKETPQFKEPVANVVPQKPAIVVAQKPKPLPPKAPTIPEPPAKPAVPIPVIGAPIEAPVEEAAPVDLAKLEVVAVPAAVPAPEAKDDLRVDQPVVKAPAAARAMTDTPKPLVVPKIPLPAPVEIGQPEGLASAEKVEVEAPAAIHAKPIERAESAQIVNAPTPSAAEVKPFVPPPVAPPLAAARPLKVQDSVSPAPIAKPESTSMGNVSVSPIVAKPAPSQQPIETPVAAPVQTLAPNAALVVETPARPAAAPTPVVENAPAKPTAEQLALLAKKPMDAAPSKPAIARAAPKPLEGFIIQMAFNDRERAQRWAEAMGKKGFAVSVTEAGAEGALRVRLGNFVLRDDAERQLKAIKQEGLNGIILNLPQAFRPEARTSIP